MEPKDMNKILQKYHATNAFGRLMGLEIGDTTPGQAEYRLKIEPHHLSNPMAVHGGVVAAMMDAILGVAALSLAVEENKLVSTVEFKINYFTPIKLGDELVGRGKVVFAGNRLISCEGEIIVENRGGTVASKGLGTFNSYPVEKNSLLMDALENERDRVKR